MSDTPIETENALTTPAAESKKTQETAQKSAFTPDESCYKINPETVYQNTHTITSCSTLRAEIAQLKAENAKLEEQLKAALNKAADQHQAAEIQPQQETTARKTCQCITTNGTTCTRTAHKSIQANGIGFWICKQHLKQFPEATEL